MNKVSNALKKVAGFLGFKRNSPYVNAYIHRANIRSGVFMAAVVFILEVWLIIRQHNKYIIKLTNKDGSYLWHLFDFTSLFWLQLFMGLAMFLYCLYYLSHNHKNKKFLFAVIISAGIDVVLCCLLPLESGIKNFDPNAYVDNTLLIALYSAILLFNIFVIIASIGLYVGKTKEWLHSVAIITIFAACLLIFGIKVSYSDFTSMKTYGTVDAEGHATTWYYDIKTGLPLVDSQGNLIKIANQDYKQIICFLMMSIYVGCLLIWKPYISVAIVGAIFLGFYLLLKSFDPSIRHFPDGDEVNYITFLISLVMVSVSIYTQRNLEAHKDEELEILATKDKVTDLYAFEYFCTLCDKRVEEENIQQKAYIYLFIDITSFKIINDQKGFEHGNEFLKQAGQIIKDEFKDGLVSRQSDDHFAVFAKNEEIKEKIERISEKVMQLDMDIKPAIKVGGYLFDRKEVNAHNAIEKARYAFANLKKNPSLIYLRYGHEMSNEYKMVQYIVAHIDEAVANGWIHPYYQPVVYSKDKKLCGVEALARWIDPQYGFLNPGVFIPALEDAQLAYKLDLNVLELVCKNMRRVIDSGETVVPTSINFSRADFSIVDIPSEVMRITKKYDIPPKYLHIEITESALLDEHADLKAAMAVLKKNGFSIWLDDFGSGYSSFNALKDYAFDVLKLDLEFLKGFSTNEKSKPLISSVIQMANQIGMRTLAEGVETEEQAAFLKKIGCEKLQGYLFSKPIPYEELNKGIADGKFVVAKKLD